MSWSIDFLGTPDKIAEQLEKESERLTGQSKIEFDAVKPSLLELVKNNFDTNPSPHFVAIVELVANGTGYVRDGVPVERNCQVTLKRHYRKILV